MAAPLAHKLGEIYRTEDIEIEENVCFSGLLLPEKILEGLTSAGFVRPSPIQLKAIPLGRCGLDLIIQAKSGTGKTCVYTVIALESLLPESLAVQVLILTPTREIAVQVARVIGLLGIAFPKLRCYSFIGGMKLSDDKTKLQNCQIVVGTPGRIKQLIGKGMLRTESIRLFVLDEADKLLERNFQEDMNWIYSSLPTNKQLIAASATYPRELAQFLTKYMRNPTFVCLNSDDPALRGIKQYYKTVAFHPVSHVLFNNKVGSVIQILNSISFSQCLIFTNYQIKAEALCSHLGSIGWPAIYISGCMDQQQRLKALDSLQQFQCRILVSTDLSSRGIDAEHVNLVINFDVPWDLETYFHRIGRAGRFGTVGIAISLTSGESEDEMFQKIKSEGHLLVASLPETIDDTIWILDKQRNAVSEIPSKEETATGEKVRSQNRPVVKGGHLPEKAVNELKMKEQQSSLTCKDLSSTDNDSEVGQYFEENEKKVSAFNIKNNLRCSDEKGSTELLDLSEGFVNGNYKLELEDSPTATSKENSCSRSDSEESIERNCEFISNHSNGQEALNNEIPVTSLISDTKTEIISSEFSEINNEVIILATESETRIENGSVDVIDTCQISTNTFADTIKEFLPAMQQVQDFKLPKEVCSSESVSEVIHEFLEKERAKVQTQTFELMHYKDVVAKLKALKVADEVAVQSNVDSSSSELSLNTVESDGQADEDENCHPIISAYIKGCEETKLSHDILEEVAKNLLESYECMNTQLDTISGTLMQIAEEKQKSILAKFEIDSASSENESINSEYEKELDLLILSDDASKVNYKKQNSTETETTPIKTATVIGSENESAELAFNNRLRTNSDVVIEHNYSKPNYYYYNANTQNVKSDLNKKIATSLNSNVHNSGLLTNKSKIVEIPNYVDTAEKDDSLSSLDLTGMLYGDSVKSLGQCQDKTVPSERFETGKDKLIFRESLCNTVNQDKQATHLKTDSSEVNILVESKKVPTVIKNKDVKLNENSVQNTGINSEKTRSVPLSPIIQLANKKITQSQYSSTNESSGPEDEDSDSEYSDRSDYRSNNKHLFTYPFNLDYLKTTHQTTLETQNGKLKQKAAACAATPLKDVSLSTKEYSLPLVDTEASAADRKPTGSPRTNRLREQSAKMKTPHYDTRAAGDTLDNSGINTDATKQSQMPNTSNEAVANAWHSYWQKWQEVVHLASSASNQDYRDDTATTSSHDKRRSAHSHRKGPTRRARNKSRLPKSVSECEEDYECQRNAYEKYIDQWKRYWEEVNKYFNSYHSNRIRRHKHKGQKKRCHSHRPCCHSESQPFSYMHNTAFPYYQHGYGVSGPCQYPCSYMHSWLQYKQYFDYIDYVTSMYRY